MARRVERSVLEYDLVIRVLQVDVANVYRVVTGFAEERGEPRRQRVVDQEPHSPAASGNVRSRTASAAKRSASRMSSGSRSGYAARMSWADCPSATNATMVATGMRSPRRHGTPPIWRGLVVTRLNAIPPL